MYMYIFGWPPGHFRDLLCVNTCLAYRRLRLQAVLGAVFDHLILSSHLRAETCEVKENSSWETIGKPSENHGQMEVYPLVI